MPISTKVNRTVIVLVIAGLIGLGLWLILSSPTPTPLTPAAVPTETEPVIKAPEPRRVIGSSVNGRAIESYTYGTGETNVLFVGGIHGGYEWNSVLLAYNFIDELEEGTFLVPSNLTLTIIPALNPDGLYSVTQTEGRFTAAEIPANSAHETGQGRFNANAVDLNRNFDCKWQPESTWRGKTVSAGTAAFSEPEARALLNLVTEINPVAVVFWHSQANAVYASECKDGVLPQTLKIMNAYATAGGYKAVSSFDAYPISGDAEGWLASLNIPAITVELETRTDPEWSRNRAGIATLLALYPPQ